VRRILTIRYSARRADRSERPTIRIRRTISIEAWLWTLGITFLMVTSEYIPPNTATADHRVPRGDVLAYYVKKRVAFGALVFANGALLAGLSRAHVRRITLRP